MSWRDCDCYLCLCLCLCCADVCRRICSNSLSKGKSFVSKISRMSEMVIGVTNRPSESRMGTAVKWFATMTLNTWMTVSSSLTVTMECRHATVRESNGASTSAFCTTNTQRSPHDRNRQRTPRPAVPRTTHTRNRTLCKKWTMLDCDTMRFSWPVALIMGIRCTFGLLEAMISSTCHGGTTTQHAITASMYRQKR